MGQQKSGKPKSRLSTAQLHKIGKALSDARRFEILQHIARDHGCTCAELLQSSKITPATLSHHLKELQAAGLIRIERQGKFARPSFRREMWKTYLAQLAELVKP